MKKLKTKLEKKMFKIAIYFTEDGIEMGSLA